MEDSIRRLEEMGIPNWEAAQLLQDTKSLEAAIDLYLSNSTKFSFQPRNIPTLSTFNRVKDEKSFNFQVETCEPRRRAYKTGLLGLKDVHLSSLLQALARWNDGVEILFKDTIEHVSVADGNNFENCNVPFSQLLKHIQEVIACLHFSSRNVKSCVRVGLAFASYRRYLGLYIPSTLPETWTYLLHALNISELFDLSYLSIFGGDVPKTVAGVQHSGTENIYESIDRLICDGYLFENGNQIPKGKLFPVFLSDSDMNSIPSVIYIDRYIRSNGPIVKTLVKKQLQLKSQLAILQDNLRDYLTTDFGMLKGMVEYIKKANLNQVNNHITNTHSSALHDSHISSALNSFQSNLREAQVTCMLKIEALSFEYLSLFDVAELKDCPFCLKAIFLEESTSEYSVCVLDQNHWYYFRKDSVTPILFEAISTLSAKAIMLWYIAPSNTPLSIPSTLQSLVEKDNLETPNLND